jgi:hypothetical protein
VVEPLSQPERHNKARLPRIRLQVDTAGRVETLLGYLVTDGDGVVWAIPEISKDHQAATPAVAYRLDMAEIDTPVAGMSDQVFSYRDVLHTPEKIDREDAAASWHSPQDTVNRQTPAIVESII